MTKTMRYFLILLLSGISFFNSLSAQSVVKLKNNNTPIHIGNNTMYLEDASLGLKIEDVMSSQWKAMFKATPQEIPNFSSTASAYWLKFDVEKVEEGNFYLEIGSSFMDSISLYEFDDRGGLLTQRFSGDDLPFNQREVEVGNFLFSLNMPVGTTRSYFLRIKSNQPLFFPLRVGNLKAFTEYTHDKDFLQGIYFGFMFLIMLYNLFLYYGTKDKIYLYYVTYVISITLFMASVFGYFFEYIWPNSPFLNRYVVLTSGLTMITATLFTQNFLNTKKVSPKHHMFSRTFSVTGVLVILLTLTKFKIIGLQLAQAGLLFMSIYFLYLGIVFKRRGYGPAKYYLLAWGVLVVGIFFAMLESLDVIPVLPYVNAMQIGSGLEVVLLSFALGDRINSYKRQKVEAQELALKTSRENEMLIARQNTILEKKVKERTEQIEKKNEELVNLNKEKDNLINVVAHDLRSPLNQMKGFIQLIHLTSSSLNSEQEAYLNEMHQTADRLSNMISRILDVNAIAANEIALKMEVVDLGEIVTYLISYYQFSADEKNIRFHLDSNKGDHKIEVDRNYLIQILENLITNALKFSYPHSEVKIRVISEGSRCRVEVEDKGPGISKEDQKRLFGKFSKLTAKPTAGESSTGLGLSIAKKYIEAMKGTIECISDIGKGTTFIVSFNCATVMEEAEE